MSSRPPISPSNSSPAAASGGASADKPARRPFEMSTAELWNASSATPGHKGSSRSSSCTGASPFPSRCSGFSLVGLTLGTTTKKGGRTSGFVLSLVLVITFYALVMNGLRLASVEKLPPWFGAWGANILLVGARACPSGQRGTGPLAEPLGFVVGLDLEIRPREPPAAPRRRAEPDPAVRRCRGQQHDAHRPDQLPQGARRLYFARIPAVFPLVDRRLRRPVHRAHAFRPARRHHP